MPYIPTYKRQVYSNRAPIDHIHKKLPESLIPSFDPKQGKAVLAQYELERRKTRQATVSNIMRLGQQVFSAIGQLQQAHIATKIREAETVAKNTFDQLYQQFQYDPNYEGFEQQFEKAQKKLYDDQTKEMMPAVRKAYEQKFKGLKGQYETKVQGLVFEKDHAHGVASMKWQLSNAVEKGDKDMLKQVLFGEDIVDRPKQPAASGAPMAVGDWLETPAGGKSRHYGATAEEIEAYLEDPEAAVEQYYTPTRIVGGQEKELSEEDYRKYLDAHARAYQKDAYLETGEAREAITTTHVPGAVENGYVSREAALQLYEDGLYEMMRQQVTRGLKTAHPEKALQKLNETDENGNYALAPELKEKDRDDLEASLTADLRELQYRLDRNERAFRDVSSGHFKNEYFSGALSWGKLLQAAKNYEKLDFHTDENDPNRAIHPSDAAQIFRWMDADAKGRETGGDDGQLSDIQDQVFSRLFESIDNKEADHYELDKAINESRSSGLLDKTGHSQLIRFNNQENPDEILAGYLDRIKKSAIESGAKGTLRTAFTKAYNKNKWVDGNIGGEMNPDAWTDKELDRLYNSLVLPYAEQHLAELHESIKGAKVRMYQGGTSYTGRQARDMEEIDNYEEVVRAISEGYINEIPKDQIPHVDKYIQFVKGNQLEWYDLMTDDSGFKRNWYKGMVAPRKSHRLENGAHLVITDENDKEWATYLVNGTEQWMEYKDEDLTEGAIRFSPDNRGYVYVDGEFRSVEALKAKGLIQGQEYGMGMVTKVYVKSNKAEENTGNPWIEIQQ